MASWKHKAYSHDRRGSYFFQINIPLDYNNINEFEVVAFKNGVVVDKAVFWDSVETHREGIDMVYDNLTYIPDYSEAVV